MAVKPSFFKGVVDNITGDFGKAFSSVDDMKKSAKAHLRSNQGVNSVGNTGENVNIPTHVFTGDEMKSSLTGGFAGTAANMRLGHGPIDSLRSAHQKIGDNGEMRYSASKIAGSVFTGGVALRVAGGGGVYRDSSGNTDIAGIPFI